MSEILPVLIDYLLSLAAIALLSVLSWGAAKLADRFAVLKDSDVLSAATWIARRAVMAAEEWAYSKTKVTGARVPSAEKLEYAVMIMSKAFPKIDRDELEGLVLGALKEYREERESLSSEEPAPPEDPAETSDDD